uniref:BED-type domain-containing protein n=1 Tax=Astyanax mexicanus TaxID=7994 RepID=A0A3B1JDP8_ASTMX
MSERKRSAVWLYFDAQNESTASCIVCNRAVKYSGNTTNLYKHMKNHAAENAELQKRREEERHPSFPGPDRPSTQRQKSLAEAFQSSSREYPADSPRAEEITRGLAGMIVKDLQPLSIVQDKGFQDFVKTLDPKYRIPSRKSLSEGKLPALYKDCSSKVRRALNEVDNVVLTTDMWTSRTTEGYLTVTSHIVNEHWQMQAFVLETCAFPGQHTADNICSQLTRIVEEWGIKGKIVAVVTDNGANMVAAVRKAGWAHYPCFAHTLNLVVKDSLKAVPNLVEIQKKTSAIVSFFHHSTTATSKLKEVQKQQKFPEQKLLQSVETRWNSLFYMWERLSEQKDAVTTVLCLLGKSSLCLTQEEWSEISLSLNALRPFEEVTREISAEKHISISKVIPLVSLLQRTLSGSEQEGSKLAAELLAQSHRRFRTIETFYGLAVSTYLDIRFKNMGFRDSSNVEPIKARLVTEMQSMSQTSAPPSTATSSATRSAISSAD